MEHDGERREWERDACVRNRFYSLERVQNRD
jgi:hypothetical protein